MATAVPDLSRCSKLPQNRQLPTSANCAIVPPVLAHKKHEKYAARHCVYTYFLQKYMGHLDRIGRIATARNGLSDISDAALAAQYFLQQMSKLLQSLQCRCKA
jgi:hypothetical protein